MVCQHWSLTQDNSSPDNQIHTIHDQPNSDQDDEDKLVITQGVSNCLVDVGEDLIDGMWKLVIPVDGREGCAGQVGCEEVIETEREGSGPGADKQNLEKRVRELV